RVDFDGRGGIDQTAPCPDERRPYRAREARRSSTGGLTRRSAHSYSLTELVQAIDGDKCGRQGWCCDSARARSQSPQGEPSRPAMKVPLAWRILTYDKRRTALALIGIFMAILLVFVDLGFFYAVPRGGLLLYDNIRFDLLLTSDQYEYQAQPGTFPLARLDQARGSPDVQHATPIYFGFGKWKDGE